MKTIEFEKNGIKTVITKSDIEVTDLGVGNFQKKGTKTATLKQTIKTTSYYPTKKITSNMQDNIYDLSDFGEEFKPEPYENVRVNVAFLNEVPEKETLEGIRAKMLGFPDACLYRVLSNEPFLTDNQKYAILQGLKTKEEFAKSQVVRNSAGNLILDKNGKVQYKCTFFSSTAKEDLDYRTSDPEDMYMTDSIELEYNEAILMAV